MNTINICVSHVPVPPEMHRYIDLLMSPVPLPGPTKVAVVDDGYFGVHGHSLSEYAQLLWLGDHFEQIVGAHKYVRLFQYRRFCSTRTGGRHFPPQPWARAIAASELPAFESEFSRDCHGELFNTPIQLPDGVVGQYAQAHVLEDMLRFVSFLGSLELHPLALAGFLTRTTLIPACDIGVFQASRLRDILAYLRGASTFMDTPAFVPRTGPQRRNMGFLLERLNSQLLLAEMQEGRSKAAFGHNIIIAEAAGSQPQPAAETDAAHT